MDLSVRSEGGLCTADVTVPERSEAGRCGDVVVADRSDRSEGGRCGEVVVLERSEGGRCGDVAVLDLSEGGRVG